MLQVDGLPSGARQVLVAGAWDVLLSLRGAAMWNLTERSLVAGAWDVLLSFRGAAMWNLTEKRHKGYRPFAH